MYFYLQGKDRLRGRVVRGGGRGVAGSAVVGKDLSSLFPLG